ncbi:MAG: surface lipoprotein assembly modifier [Gemmatimonadetes bacterium]|nr:surface lipoprotein assembly modifier [Gemmatimonadota bacterium]
MKTVLDAAGVLAILLILAVSSTSHADETAGERIEISPIQAGRLLFRAGRIQDARKLLERARPENEEERIERLFLLGLIDARSGFPRRAARRFETILAQRPELTRVRLELAQVYHSLGLDEKARFHFESSLADKLPSSVEAAVEGFLNRIDARKRWSLSFSTAVLPESNPAKRTSRGQVRIGGVPFQLDRDARGSSGVGYLVTTGASFSPTIADHVRGVLAASSAAKLYKQPDWNDVSLNGEIGLARLFDKGTLSGGLRLGRRWLAADPYSREIGPWMRGRLHLPPASRLDVSLSAVRRDHHGREAQNGWRFSARPVWTYALSSPTSIETSVDVELTDARERHHASRMGGLGISVRHAFRGGLSISPSVSALVRRHAGLDPLFLKTRSDRQLRIGVNVLHRALRYRGFAPYAGYSVEWNRSNIPLHTYRNHGAVFGISRKF